MLSLPKISKIKPTTEQFAILDAASGTRDNLIITARAGCAKTSTLKLVADRLRDKRILYIAFNRRIADEAAASFPGNVTCATLNSIGHRAWANAISSKIVFDPKKANKIASDIIRTHSRIGIEPAILREALDAARHSGYTPPSSRFPSLVDRDAFLDRLDDDLDEPLGATGRMCLNDALAKSTAAAYKGLIDFVDQLYLPAIIGGKFDEYDLILADEVQDFSEINYLLVKHLATSTRPNHKPRVIAVGDSYQGIYLFRGAMPNAVERMGEAFAMKPFCLTTSFRCAQSITRNLRWRAPDIRSTTKAPEGSVETFSAWGPSSIPPDSAIICRNNAPLYDLGSRLLRLGVPSRVIGSQIGSSLARNFRELGPLQTPRDAAITALSAWSARKRLTIKPEALSQFADRVESMAALINQSETLGEAIDLSARLSSTEGRVTLLTGHKSKGLEYETVIHLDPHRIPSPYARDNPAALEQESNLQYVIDSRPRLRLFYATLAKFNPHL